MLRALSQRFGMSPGVGLSGTISILLAFRLTLCTQFHEAWRFRPSVITNSVF